MRSCPPPVKNTADAPAITSVRGFRSRSSRSDTSRCAICFTPSAVNALWYSLYVSSGSSVARVAMTSFPPLARSATARRIIAFPSRSSCPPMMISVPWARGTFGRGIRAAPGRSGRRIRLPLPLVLLAMKLDAPFRFLEEFFTHRELPLTHHPLATGNHLSQLERAGIQHQQVTVFAALEAPLRFELQDFGRVLRGERQDLLQREPAFQHAGAQLIQHRFRAALGGIGRNRQPIGGSVMLLIELQPSDEVVVHHVDVYRDPLASQIYGFTHELFAPLHMGSVQPLRADLKATPVGNLPQALHAPLGVAHVEVSHAAFSAEHAAV